MANVKISELTEITTLENADVFPVVDSTTNTTKKASVETLKRAIVESDTDWTFLSNGVMYRKNNNTVCVDCAMSNQALTINAWTTLDTLPAGYRPSRTISGSASFGNAGQYSGLFQITNAGLIQYFVSSSAASEGTKGVCFYAAF